MFHTFNASYAKIDYFDSNRLSLTQDSIDFHFFEEFHFEEFKDVRKLMICKKHLQVSF